MRVPPWVVCVFSGVFLSSRVTGACPVTTDLIMRVNVRTTTTTIENNRISMHFLVCKGLSIDDVGVSRDTPYFRRYGRELVSKTGDFVKEKLGGLP